MGYGDVWMQYASTEAWQQWEAIALGLLVVAMVLYGFWELRRG